MVMKWWWYINKIRAKLLLLSVISSVKLREALWCLSWRNNLINMKGYKVWTSTFNSSTTTTFIPFNNNLSPNYPLTPPSYTASNCFPSFQSQRPKLIAQNFKPHILLCTSLPSKYHFPPILQSVLIVYFLICCILCVFHMGLWKSLSLGLYLKC